MDYNIKVIDHTTSVSDHLARYHYGGKESKTFTVMKGGVRVIVNGKMVVLAEGDIFNAEAWCPYNMTFLENDTVVREISEEGCGTEFTLPDPAAWIDADKAQIREVSEKGKGIYQFDTKGMSLLLKVGRWQLNGIREIWECRIDNGYRIAFNDRSESENVVMIRRGLFRFETDGAEFIAGSNGNDIVRIPAKTAYAFTAASDDCVIQDFQVTCHLFRLLEMVEAAQDYFPEKLEMQEYIDYLFEANKVVAFESFKKEENE